MDKVKAMINIYINIHFNPNSPIKLACDESKEGIGAVLLYLYPDGTSKSICFASRTLLGALAIYWGVGKFYQYLLGAKFILDSDYKPLMALFGEEREIPIMAVGRLQRWALYLSGFNFELRYVKGTITGGRKGRRAERLF